MQTNLKEFPYFWFVKQHLRVIVRNPFPVFFWPDPDPTFRKFKKPHPDASEDDWGILFDIPDELDMAMSRSLQGELDRREGGEARDEGLHTKCRYITS